jgi:hypothetical protein
MAVTTSPVVKTHRPPRAGRRARPARLPLHPYGQASWRRSTRAIGGPSWPATARSSGRVCRFGALSPTRTNAWMFATADRQPDRRPSGATEARAAFWIRRAEARRVARRSAAPVAWGWVRVRARRGRGSVRGGRDPVPRGRRERCARGRIRRVRPSASIEQSKVERLAISRRAEPPVGTDGHSSRANPCRSRSRFGWIWRAARRPISAAGGGSAGTRLGRRAARSARQPSAALPPEAHERNSRGATREVAPLQRPQPPKFAPRQPGRELFHDRAGRPFPRGHRGVTRPPPRR